LDHWFGPIPSATQLKVTWSFNPCCFGSLVRADSPVQIIPRQYLVSILVVLDHWFGHRNASWRCGTPHSFNPCCFGSLVRASVWSHLEHRESSFQSLLFWIIGSGTELANRFPPLDGFQSLLFWIIGSGSRVLTMAAPPIRVSILVVLDHWFGRKTKNTLKLVARVSILVVLDHWFGPKVNFVQILSRVVVSILVVLDHWFGPSIKSAPCLISSGFNPCCFGSLVRALASISTLRSAKVSILVVLDHWFGPHLYMPIDCNTHVSILVVLDHWFGQSKPPKIVGIIIMFQSLLFWIIGSGLFIRQISRSKEHGFQSLLFWIIGSGPLPPMRRRTLRPYVSILVVLDHWFGRSPFRRRAQRP